MFETQRQIPENDTDFPTSAQMRSQTHESHVPPLGPIGLCIRTSPQPLPYPEPSGLWSTRGTNSLETDKVSQIPDLDRSLFSILSHGHASCKRGNLARSKWFEPCFGIIDQALSNDLNFAYCFLKLPRRKVMSVLNILQGSLIN